MTTRAILLVSLLLASACGYGPSADLACNDFAQALCDVHDACTGGTYFPRTFIDRSTCVRRFQLGCMINVTAKDVQRTPLQIEACVREMLDPTMFSCNDVNTNDVPPACVLPGKRPNGAACGLSSQCASDYCSGLRTSTCGTCGPAPTPGASCVASDCANGQECHFPEDQCEVPIAMGAPCEYESMPCGCASASISTVPLGESYLP